LGTAKRFVRALLAPGRSGRRRLLVLYALGLIPALALALLQPVWGRSDEAAQFDVVAQYAHGVYPKLGVTTITPQTLAIDEATGVYSWDAASPPPVVSDATFGPIPHGLSVWPARLWAQRHLWEYSYEALQPPVYYALATPAWLIGNSLGGTWGAVYALRVFSALVLALLVPLVYLLALEVLPRRPRLAVAAALATGFLPGLLLNGTAFDNDTGAVVAGAAILLLCFRGWRSGWTMSRALVLGLACGIGFLIKPDVAGLAPAVAISLLHGVGGTAASPVRRRIVHAAITGVTAGLCVAPWLVANAIVYGSPTTAAAGQLLNTGLGVGGLVSLRQWLLMSLVNVNVTFFGGEFPSPPGVVFTCLVGALLVLCAAVAGWRRRRGRGGRAPDPEVRDALGLLAFAVLGCVVLGFLLPALSNTSYLTPGRYIFPAAGAGMILIVAVLANGRLAERERAAVLGLLIAAELAVALALPSAIPAPGHTGPEQPPASAPISHLAARATYAGLTVQVDQRAQQSGGAWVHVTVTDTGPTAVDWDPMPNVWVGNLIVGAGDYTTSSPLPETLLSGQTVQGWIHLLPYSGQSVGSAAIALSFTNVAADGYTVVGNLGLRLPR
jgi:hypothetical protein